MRGGIFLSALWVAAVGFADETQLRFLRTCTVYLEPSLTSQRLCQKKIGATVLWHGEPQGGFVQVETTDCTGFVPDACLSQGEVVRRDKASVAETGRRYLFRVGLGATLDGSLSTVSGASEVSHGDGWSLQARAQFGLGRRWQLTVAPGYHVLGLSRQIDMTGALVDPTPVSFTQRVQYFGMMGLVGFVAHRDWFDNRPTLSPEVVIEGGLHFLTPVGARQTTSVGTSVEFKSSNKALFLVLGPAMDIAFSPTVSVLAYLHGYYNLLSKDAKLFGGRLGLALQFGI